MSARGRDPWLGDYALLALRLDRLLVERGQGPALIYTGPDEPREAVAAQDPVEASRLLADLAALRETIPFEGVRADRLRTNLDSMQAVAEYADGAALSFTTYASRCLGVSVSRVPDQVLGAAHERLAAALPAGAGSLAQRLHAWQRAHQLPADRVAEFARMAVDECVARTRAFTELPDEITIEVRHEPGPNRGHHAGGGHGAIHLGSETPFNGADLLYVVAHETFPGHIAESMLTHGADSAEPERAVRFMLSPAFVIGEGIGLHAPQIAFPAGEAQDWLTEHVLAPLGIPADGSDFASIHQVRTTLWGAWGNAAIMRHEGQPEDVIADYLRRWALTTEAETAWALGYLAAAGAGAYVQGYYQGWRIVRDWLDTQPDRRQAFARLLTEPLLPAELLSTSG